MDILHKIVILLLITLTRGEADHELDVMKQMIKALNLSVSEALDKLAKTDAELEATKEHLAEALNNLSTSQHDLFVALNDLANSQNDVIANINNLTITQTDLLAYNNDMIAKAQNMDDDIRIIKNPPHMHACGALRSFSMKSSPIRYTSLLYSSTNTEGGGLDITSGVFTSSWPGSYTVTWSLYAYNHPGDHDVDIVLQKNGKSIDESYHASYYSGPSGLVDDQGINIAL